MVYLNFFFFYYIESQPSRITTIYPWMATSHGEGLDLIQNHGENNRSIIFPKISYQILHIKVKEIAESQNIPTTGIALIK